MRSMSEETLSSTSAQFAHADHVQLLGRAAGGAHRPAVPLREPAVEVRERGREGDFGQGRGSGDHFGEIGEAADVARDQPQHHPLAQHAQRALQRGFVGCRMRREE